jgi:hypothetical protein
VVDVEATRDDVAAVVLQCAALALDRVRATVGANGSRLPFIADMVGILNHAHVGRLGWRDGANFCMKFLEQAPYWRDGKQNDPLDNVPCCRRLAVVIERRNVDPPGLSGRADCGDVVLGGLLCAGPKTELSRH